MVGSPIAGRVHRDRGAADRFLRQHAGAAHATCPASPRFVGSAGGEPADDPGRVRPPARAVRDAGRGAAAGAQPEPQPAVPDPVRAAERGGRGHVGSARRRLEPVGRQQRHREVRSGARCAGARERSGRSTGCTRRSCSTRRRSSGWRRASGCCWRASWSVPEESIEALPLLTRTEREQVLVGVERHGAASRGDACRSIVSSRPRPRGRRRRRRSGSGTPSWATRD